MEFLLIFWTNRLSAQFPTITRSEVYLRQESLKLRQSSNWAANLFKIWQNSNAAFVVFYLFFIIYQKSKVWIVTIFWIIEDAHVKTFIFCLPIPRAQANTVQHTYLIVVSITEIIEYYKNGYLSATVGTRLHLASGWSDDHSGA